jgi:hypothetical protein
MKLAALLLLGGCSFIMGQPPENPRRSDCHVVPPIVDTVGVAGIVALNHDENYRAPGDDTFHPPSAQREVTEFVVGAVFVASAIYGYIVYGACRRDAASP